MRNHVTVTWVSRDNVFVLTCVGYCHVFRSLNPIGWWTSRDVFGSQFLGTISLVVDDHVGGRCSAIGWFKSRVSSHHFKYRATSELTLDVLPLVALDHVF